MTKDEILKFIYFDPAGYGSVKETYADARKKDKSITMKDVKDFIDKHVEQKKQLRGYNSFIAHEPKEEYQLDLFFIPKRDFPNETFVGGVLVIDIFTKFISIIPIKSKTIPEILAAIKEIMKQMGKPQTIYSDNEGSWSAGTEISKYFENEKIRHIITLSHPAFSERAIRTIKGEIYKRVKPPSDVNWNQFLYPILAKYNYKTVHSSTGFTPNEAAKRNNTFNAKLNMEMHRSKTRIYPDIEIGDYVRIHKKKSAMDKENVSTWSDRKYKVNNIEESHGQKLYFLDDYKQNDRVVGLLRHDILLTV
jgi:hypothetical protein